MNRINLKSWTAYWGTCTQPLRRALGTLHRDQYGATMTEFVIILPIFVAIFSGVMLLGEFSRKGTEAPVVAYKRTFSKALAYQKSYFHVGANIDALGGAATSTDQLSVGFAGDTSRAHNNSGLIQLTTNATELAAYAGLGVNGSMGESYLRIKPLGEVPGVDIIGADSIGPSWCTDCKVLNGSPELLTRKLKDRTGESKYAFALLNDSKFASEFSTSGGALAAINSFVSAGGIRPAVAAGIRYGTVSGQAKDTIEFAGRSMDFDAHFSTLVPPATTGGSQGPRLDAMRATGVARFTMEGEKHYSKLLGIQTSQKMPGSANFTVEDYP